MYPGSPIKRQIFKAVSIILIQAFLVYSTGFAQAGLVASLSPKETQSIDNLAPYLISKLVPLDENETKEMKKLDEKVSSAATERAKEFAQGWIDEYAEGWTQRAKAKAREKDITLSRRTLLNAFRLVIQDGAERVGLSGQVKEEIDSLVEQHFKRMVSEDGAVSPGRGAVRHGLYGILEPLDEYDHNNLNKAIRATLNDRTAPQAGRYPAPATGGTFVVLDDQTYEKYLEQFKAPKDVVCHPGTWTSRIDPDTGVNKVFGEGEHETFDQEVSRYYYMRKSFYDSLTEREKDAFARHEEMHIMTALGVVKVPEGESEERFVNARPGCDIRHIMAERGSVPHMKDILMTDTTYGDAVRKYISVMDSKIKALVDEGAYDKVFEEWRGESAGEPRAKDAKTVKKLSEELDEFIRKVYRIRYNIDLMRTSLNRPSYEGYEVIVVSSSTLDEARSKQELLEELFKGIDNVAVFSVVVPENAGQLLSTVIALEQVYRIAMKREDNPLDIRRLMEAGAVRLAMFHDGGKGERASPITQSLGNARGRQDITGSIENARGQDIGAELLPMVILNSLDFARSLRKDENGNIKKDRTDVFWTSQIAFGTIDHAKVPRINAPMDKFLVPIDWSLPEEVLLPLLYQFGTCVTDENGYITKFYGNQKNSPVQKTADGYKLNPAADKELIYKTLTENKDRAYFDFGSFSMRNEMLLALWDYWAGRTEPVDGKNVSIVHNFVDRAEKGEVVDVDKNKWKRDIDPKFTQPLSIFLQWITLQENKWLLEKAKVEMQTAKRSNPDTKNEIIREMIARIKEKIPEGVGFEMGGTEDELKGKDNPCVAEVIEFFLLNVDNENIFGDLKKVIGKISLGKDTDWQTFRSPIAIMNEKLFMLTDLTGHVVEVEKGGKLAPARKVTVRDLIRAENARRRGSIKDEAVCHFWVGGKEITLSKKDVTGPEPWAGEGVVIHRSIVQDAVLEPGSVVIRSVVEKSHGKIKAENSYVQRTTACELDAKNSFIHMVVSEGNPVAAENKVVTDIFRKGVQDTRDLTFYDEHTRLEVPVDYDSKEKIDGVGVDGIRFDPNLYAFGEKDREGNKGIRAMECCRSDNEYIENKARLRAMVANGLRVALRKHVAYLAGMNNKLNAPLIQSVLHDFKTSNPGKRAREEMVYFCNVLREYGSGEVKDLAERTRNELLADKLYGPTRDPEEIEKRVREKMKKFEQLKFGTSGIRGRAIDTKEGKAVMTDLECYLNTKAYIEYLKELGPEKGGIGSEASIVLAGDLRATTDRIMHAVAKAVVDSGCTIENAGLIPTPAAAYYAQKTNNRVCIMVTGSHIASDQNGIKFYKRGGEVLKADEADIMAHAMKVRKEEYSKDDDGSLFTEEGYFKSEVQIDMPGANDAAEKAYVDRYVKAFPAKFLEGVTVVLYEHSAVGRDIAKKIFTELGAEVISAERSGEFVAVDTENIERETAALLKKLAAEHGSDVKGTFAVISTDGDSDRPLFTDEKGKFLPGDKLGLLTVWALEDLGVKVNFAAIPISANQAVVNSFSNRKAEKRVKVKQTKIGSPHVIKAMNDELEDAKRENREVPTLLGWEVNGGFLLGSGLNLGGESRLEALATRDSVLPLICSLYLAKKAREGSVSKLVKTLPGRYTCAGLKRPFKREDGKKLIESLKPENTRIEQVDFVDKGTRRGIIIAYRDNGTRKLGVIHPEAVEMIEMRNWLVQGYLEPLKLGNITSINFLDGVRITLESGEILHFRPSGNADEFRVYAESKSQSRSERLVLIGTEKFIPHIKAYLDKAREDKQAQLDGRSPGTGAVRTGLPMGSEVSKEVLARLETQEVVAEMLKRMGVGAKVSELTGTLGFSDRTAASMYYDRGFHTSERMLERRILPKECIVSQKRYQAGEHHTVYSMTHMKSPDSVLHVATVFNRKSPLFPGSIVYQATGSHFQADNFDIKYVREGYGVQLMPSYDESGNVVEVHAQFLSPGTWTFALPGRGDIVVNLGRLVFSDRSFKISDGLTSEIARNMGLPSSAIRNEKAAEDLKAKGMPFVFYMDGMKPRIALNPDYEGARDISIKWIEPLVPRYGAIDLSKQLDIVFNAHPDKMTEYERYIMPMIESDAFARTIIRDITGTDAKADERFGAQGEMEDLAVIHPFSDVKAAVSAARAYEKKGYLAVAIEKAKKEGLLPLKVPREEDARTLGKLEIIRLGEELVVEKFQIADYMEKDAITGDRQHVLYVEKGEIQLVSNGKIIAVLGEGMEYMVPAGTGKYKLRTAGGPSVVYMGYAPLAGDRAVNTTYQVLEKHSEVVSKQKVYLLVDRRMYVISKAKGRDVEGAIKAEEEALRESTGADVKIVHYDGKLGLEKAAEKWTKDGSTKSIRDGSTTVLIATAENLEHADLGNENVKELLASAKTIPIPDLDGIERGKGWFFTREVEGAALLLAATKLEDVQKEKDIAKDLRELMSQLTGKPVDIKTLLLLMPFGEVLSAEEMKDPKVIARRLSDLIKKLLIDVPMKPYDAEDELNKRREILWSA